MKKIERVYAYQYGAYWSFTVDNWIYLCKHASKRGDYNLNQLGKQIKNKPASIKIDGSGNPYSISGFVLIIMPVDWGKSDFEMSLSQLS